MTNPNEWLNTIGAKESLREIARKTGISHATLSRQINDGAFLFDAAITLARAYGVSPVAALVANGHLTADEAGINSVEAALQLARDDQLVQAVAQRLGVIDLGSPFDLPFSEAVAGAAGREATIHSMPRRDVGAGEQTLRRVAKKKSSDRGTDEGGEA